MMMQLTGVQIQGPLGQGDMLVVMRATCPICRDHFSVGQCWTPLPKGPLNEQEAELAAQGLPHLRLSEPVHFDCVILRLVYVMNWRRVHGQA